MTISVCQIGAVDSGYIADIDIVCYCHFYMEVLLVRFEKKERNFIRKEAKKRKISEAHVVRIATRGMMIGFDFSEKTV